MSPSRIMLFVLVMAVTGLFLASPAQGDDVKDAIDRALRKVRALQNEDGSYGDGDLETDATPLMLLAFATSPRRYSDLDGPFIRKATDLIIARQEIRNVKGLDSTAHLARAGYTLAAVAAGNRIARPQFIIKTQAELLERMKLGSRLTEIAGTEAHFALFLGLLHADLGGLKALSASDLEAMELSEGIDGCKIRNLWDWAVKSRDLPEGGDAKGLEVIVTTTLDGKISMGKPELSNLGIWASVQLLALLDEKGLATDTWAGEISTRLKKRIDEALSDTSKVDFAETAALINALNLCHGRVKARAFAQGPGGPEQEDSPIVAEPRPFDEAVKTGLAFLAANQEDGRFGFGGFADPGISALCLSAVVRASRLLDREPPAYVEKGLDYLLSLQKDDGSIFQHGLANYVTSASLMAFRDTKDPKFGSAMERARQFLVTLQCDEGEGYSIEEDPNYGGVGYGGDERPDLSNTQMAVEALHAAGLEDDHEAFKKAILFLEKCQNLAEVNPTRVKMAGGKQVISGNDGGGIYSPGTSKADLDEVDEGVFVARSYGSMTYALLKSYLLAGLDPSDKRVMAAVKWIRANYTLEENPGFKKKPGKEPGQQGLYYYFLTLSRAMNALGQDKIETTDGTAHSWPEELAAKLLALQREDGSWLNDRAPRWFEGNPVLATAYALLVLDECRR